MAYLNAETQYEGSLEYIRAVDSYTSRSVSLCVCFYLIILDIEQEPYTSQYEAA
jgi:hypothetical protein